ncbi:MAG: glycosyltransferase family 1 protein [Planctomycetales bacterium]|nr:glycosyltransferase family 1 protein [Planctomycetales bacterium]
MKITIFTFGSRGDVEPYLALAKGLNSRGHTSKLVAPDRYSDWIAAHGVNWHPLKFDVGAYFNDRVASRARERPVGTIKRSLESMRALAQGTSESLVDFQRASEDADLIVQSGISLGGMELGDLLGVPVVFAHPFPATPTREFSSFVVPWSLPLGESFNAWTQRLSWNVVWKVYGPPLNKWRRNALGLPEWVSYEEMRQSSEKKSIPTLYAYSSTVCPKPKDWDQTKHVTGYWFLEPVENWSPDEDLARFLEEGPPPICIGFGSMPLPDAAHRSREVVDALKKIGMRGILITGGGGALARLPKQADVHFVDNVPYHWLLPRVSALVHHGGAGTTAAAIRAGIPSVILPIAVDQFGWARRIETLGTGVAGGNLKRLNSRSLSASIQRVVEDSAITTMARLLGDTVRKECGVATACEIIEKYHANFQRS